MSAATLDLPFVIGHRGAAAAAPENTLAGFRKAAELGARWVEFDVRLSGDGRPILLHDDTLERTTDGSGRADEKTWSELRRLDAGAWFGPSFAGERIPDLEETIGLLAELGLGANIEIKPSSGAEATTGRAVGKTVAKYWPAGLPAPLLSSFRPEALAAAREVAPAIARGLLVGAVPPDWRRQAEALGCSTINCDHRKLIPAQAAEVRQSGWPLLAYTVNEAARAAELRKWGVMAVFSDCPDALLTVSGASTSSPKAMSPDGFRARRPRRIALGEGS
jgi:glycerophosphoryl diester phosphodiesterase